MRLLTSAIAASTLAFGALSQGTNTSSVWYTTVTVTSFETYCPYATTIVNNGQTYTVTEATTLTITDCTACTATYPVVTSTISGFTLSPSSSVPAAPITTAPAGPSLSAPVTGPYNNGTTPAVTAAPSASVPVAGTGTGSAPVSSFTGAAVRADAKRWEGWVIGAVVGLAGVLL